MKFSDRSLSNLKPKSAAYDITEGSGFCVRVEPTGKKVFWFRYMIGGKRRRLILGTYPGMSLADARKAHAEAFNLKSNGIDPAAQKETDRIQKQAEAFTVGQLVDEFLTRHVKGLRSEKEYRRNLEVDVLPAWEHRQASDITRKDVLALMDSIVDRGAPNQATQVYKIVRKMFNFAIERHLLPSEHSPCDRLSPPTPDKKKTRSLSEAEIRALWSATEVKGRALPIAKAMRLILVTGQRPGEVISMEKGELSSDWWTIPEAKSKNKKAHRVPLSSLALELLGEVEHEGPVFYSPAGGKPIAVNAVAMALRRLRSEGRPLEKVPPFTPHDLRRTCATHLGRLGFGDEIIGAVLNHTRAGVTSRYNVHGYDEEKREALEAWAGELRRILH